MGPRPNPKHHGKHQNFKAAAALMLGVVIALGSVHSEILATADITKTGTLPIFRIVNTIAMAKSSV